MQLLRFPKTITIKLSDLERIALESILNQNGAYRDDEHLLHHVLGAGIAALLCDDANDDAAGDDVPSVAERFDQRTKDMEDQVEDESELTSKASLPPFPKVTRRYKDPRKQHVENYVGCPVDRQLQERLQLFLDTHPEQELEPLLAKLLDTGLDQAENNPAVLNTEFHKLNELFPAVQASSRKQTADEEFTLDFPKRLQIELTDELQRDLGRLANLLPHASDDALVVVILERGVQAALKDAKPAGESLWRRAARQRHVVRRAQLRAISRS